MKKLFVSVILMLALVTLANAQHYTVHQNSFNSVSLTFKADIPDVEGIQTSEGMFTNISIPGYNSSNAVGCPQVPVLSKLLEIPLCDSVIATVSNERYEEYDAAAIGIKSPIYPVQTSYPKSYVGERPFDQNKTVYTTDNFYAEPLVRVEKTGTMRDVTMATIYFSPVQYNPVTKRVRIYHSADVTVTFVNANIPGTYELKSRYGSPMFKTASAAVINPMETRGEFLGAPIKYLIIANSMFADNDNLNQFVNWKKRLGYIVEVAYTSDANVGTTTTSIKNYILTHYNNATPENPAPTFLLLIGDVAQLPSFSCSTLNSHVSDLYYATWTSGDNIPDCYYGRFSAQNVSQLIPQIDKTLTYEQYTMEDPSYLGKAVLIAGTDSYWGPRCGDGQIDYIYDNYINTNTTTHNYTTVYKHSYDCSSQAATIRSEIGAGCGWANYTAHGGEDGWSKPAFNNSQVSAMNNAGKYGVMIGNCCLTGKFNYSSDCFAEVLLRTANKGAMAYIGGSEVTYWYEDYYWAIGNRTINGESISSFAATYDANNLGANDRIFHTHGENPGDWTSCISGFLQSGNMAVESSNSDKKLYYWEIYHLFGDPSIRPYLGIPEQMNVTALDVIMIGTPTYSVTAAPFAYVALTYNNELVAAAFADAYGNATLTLPASLIPGEYELAIGAQNKIQYFQTINVTVPTGPYLVASDVALTSASIPNTGATINWDLTVQNMGVSNATGAYAIMTTSTPGVTMITDSVFIGNLDANGSRVISNAFAATLPADAEDLDPAAFTVTVYWSNNSSTKNVNIQILAPKLIVDNYTIQVPNNATAVSPGDLITVTFVNKNSGHAVLPSAMVDLTSNYTGAHVNTNAYAINALQPEQTTTNAFSVQISSDINEIMIVPLCYHRIYENKHLIDTVYLTIGMATETFESGDFSQFNWTNSSNSWQITNQNPYAGTYCARSKSNLGDNNSANLSITINAVTDGTISYFRKVSSEEGYDEFSFSIDGATMEELSGDVAWSQASFPVSAGNHTYKFSYSKDSWISNGSDCAWIDNIVFPGMGRMAPQDTTDDVSMSILDHNITTANIAVYPNPTSGQLTVSSNEAIRNISIYDLSGRLVESVNVNADTQVNLNVARLNSGVYFIKTQLENQQTKTSKFIKQ